MKVMLVPNSYLPQLGGLEIAVANVARELTTRGCNVTVVTTSPSLRFSETREPDGVKVYRLPFVLPRLVFRAGRAGLARSLICSLLSPFLIPLCLVKLIRIIRYERPQIVNLHYIAQNAFYVLAAQQFANFKLVVNLHGTDIEHHSHRSWPSRWLTRTTLRRADIVLSNSAYILAQAEHIMPEVKVKSAVVGNGVHPEEFSTNEEFRHARPYILSIGSFIPNKGFDTLIRAFTQVNQEHPGVDLLIAGDGYERESCRRLADRLDIGNVVHFLGKIDHSLVPALLKGCELFVLPSRVESFGIVVLEAMAAGKTVVATMVGGVPEILTHMRDGVLVEAEAPDKLAEEICSLLKDPELGRRLGAQAYHTVRERFTWAEVVRRYIYAYETVVAQRP